MSAQELLQQLSAVGLGGADDTSADSVASSQVNASASSQVNASEDDQAANERSRARAGVQRRVRRRLCWHMRKLKKERTAMRQLQAQALHHRRHGANRIHDHVMMAGVGHTLVPQRVRRRVRGRGPNGRCTRQRPCARRPSRTSIRVSTPKRLRGVVSRMP